MQSVDVIKYTDEEYGKHLTDPVCHGVGFSVFHVHFCISLLYIFWIYDLQSCGC